MGFGIKNRWALVTGASTGIGKAIAENLAKQGCNLFLVARRDHLLQEIAVQLISKYKVEVKWYALDLTHQGAATMLADQLKRYPVSILINNAGFAVAGKFEQSEWTRLNNMIDLNMRFLTQFTHLMLPRLLAMKDGARILNVGSIAGYQGVPNLVTYAATKAYVNHFTEGLNWELRNTAVKVTCLQPGQTASEFFEVAGVTEAHMANTGLMTCDEVAKVGIKAMIKGQPRLVAGFLNKLLIFSLRFSPRSSVRMVITKLFQDMGK